MGLILKVSVGVWELALLTSSQTMLLLLVGVSHFENHWTTLILLIKKLKFRECKCKENLHFSSYMSFTLIPLPHSQHFWHQICVGEEVPFTKQFCSTSWVSYNVTLFRHHLPGNSVRSHRLRPQTHKNTRPHPLQMPSASPGCHLCFWLTSYKLEGSTTPSSGSINLLEQLTEFRKTVHLLFTSLL